VRRKGWFANVRRGFWREFDPGESPTKCFRFLLPYVIESTTTVMTPACWRERMAMALEAPGLPCAIAARAATLSKRLDD
jgi:hypothetical protein